MEAIIVVAKRPGWCSPIFREGLYRPFLRYVCNEQSQTFFDELEIDLKLKKFIN
jgi:hypothetical protein